MRSSRRLRPACGRIRAQFVHGECVQISGLLLLFVLLLEVAVFMMIYFIVVITRRKDQ